MSKNRKISRIRILMIISHVLLTGFVVYWLVGRFDAEKKLLDEELRREFSISENKMLDSLIMRKINPFISFEKDQSNNKMVNMPLSGNGKSKIIALSQGSTNNAKDISLEYHDSSLFSIHINKFKQDTTEAKVYVNASNEEPGRIDIGGAIPDPDDVVLRSFKLFVEHTNDSTSEKSIVNITSDSLNENILIADFISTLSDKNLGVVWVDSAVLDTSNLESLFYYESFINNVTLGAEIQGAKKYVFGKIISNILFGIVLLLLTGMAFIISFVSLKKQIILNDLRNGFVSNISHELNTPVSTVKVALEALDNYNVKTDPKASEEYIQMAKKEVNRLEKLIQKVLLSSSIGNDDNILQIEKVNLKNLLDETILDMDLRLKKEKANIQIESSDDALEVNADRMHLQGVIINLIDNSLKYSSADPSIKIKINKLGNAILLSFTDNGIGIPSEYLKKVFDKFFRVPTGDKHNIKGYGLGLSYVAMVMERLKGDVKVKNNPDGGCTFTLTFLDY